MLWDEPSKLRVERALFSTNLIVEYVRNFFKVILKNSTTKTIRTSSALVWGNGLPVKSGYTYYSLRRQMVQPAFTVIKHVMNFRQIVVRDLKPTGNEWNMNPMMAI